MSNATTNIAIKTKGRTEVITCRIVVSAGAAPLATKSRSPKGDIDNRHIFRRRYALWNEAKTRGKDGRPTKPEAC